MTAPRPGLVTRLGPAGIAAIVASVLVVFGLGAMILPALGDGSGSSGAERAAPPASAPEPASSSAPTSSSAPAPSSAPAMASSAPPVSTAPAATRTTPVSANFNTDYEDRAVQLINNERRKRRCDPLRVDGRLRTAARGHAADMAARDFTGSSGSDGSDPAGRVRAAGYTAFANELTAKGGDPGDTVKRWVRGDNTHAVLVDCGITSIGAGVAMRGRTPYWTVDIGRA
ncbi:CAP domain-containing protein [Dactylosporangium sp. NPDC000555]|uniref:CAP domain-containing protein n=1 Tax=Dactylosporangium sp. NPDC000555 TaxID=3154260 RepID=UPI003321CFAA